MLFLLEVYRNVVTRPICRDTRAKDRATKKFATATHTHSPFSIEDAWRATQVRWFFGTLVHHLLRLLVFQMKSLFPDPTVQLLIYWLVMQWEGLPRWCSGKESACQCRRLRRCRLVSWIGKIPWSRKWQPTPVFLPGKSHSQRSLVGYNIVHGVTKESDTTEQLNEHHAVRSRSLDSIT